MTREPPIEVDITMAPNMRSGSHVIRVVGVEVLGRAVTVRDLVGRYHVVTEKGYDVILPRTEEEEGMFHAD